MGQTASPCRFCTKRQAVPVSCRTTCEAWKEWEQIHATEKNIELQNRIRYSSEARQTIDSCMRNRHYKEKFRR